MTKTLLRNCWCMVFMGLLLPAPATHAVDVNFTSVTYGVYAYGGDKGARTYDNEDLNANIGLIVTPAARC